MNPLDLLPLATTLARDGLLRRGGGSLSFLDEDRIVMTATESDFHALKISDLVPLTMTGRPIAADGPTRSREWALHVAAYNARGEARVVVHSHSPSAIALSMLGRSLPTISAEQYLTLGSRVPLVRYIAPTTTQLASASREALKQAPAVLLQNHGIIVTARGPDEAFQRVSVLDEACGIYLRALSVGTPQVLSERAMRDLDRLIYSQRQQRHGRG